VPCTADVAAVVDHIPGPQVPDTRLLAWRIISRPPIGLVELASAITCRSVSMSRSLCLFLMGQRPHRQSVIVRPADPQ
jgi:hypothetical protein